MIILRLSKARKLNSYQLTELLICSLARPSCKRTYSTYLHRLRQPRISPIIMSQTPTTSQSSPVDILILGAGPAGLSIATGVARLLHSAIVFSSNTFRNQESQHMHAVPTWDHRDPAEFRAAARRDLLARYGTTSFVDVGIKTIKKSERKDGSSLFEAIDDNGKSWWGRKVVLATGIKDVFPNIDGYSECWVKGM
jgi:hypothetical protein